ncbi:MAG: hypothetical protein M4579_000984 [Chaenotheca gracillima]|nr:MAG: hypothetical protein M4579_000984 [Chaenotheca gracillima]
MTESEMLENYESARKEKLPFIVAEHHAKPEETAQSGVKSMEGDVVIGWACAHAYRGMKPGYRHTVEITMMLAPTFVNRGVGTHLLRKLLAILRHPGQHLEFCDRDGAHQHSVREVLAVMALDENIGGSGQGRALKQWYERFGFEQAGRLKKVGWKFDRWSVDILMAKPLGGQRISFSNATDSVFQASSSEQRSFFRTATSPRPSPARRKSSPYLLVNKRSLKGAPPDLGAMGTTTTLEAKADGHLKKTFLGSIDQGTSSTRFLIFDGTGVPVASHQMEFKQMYPHSGWHEHDPYELVSSVEICIEKAVAKFTNKGYSAADIQAIGITNQRETTVVWDTETGEALYNAIAWPDTRTKNIVHELKRRKGAEDLLDICGLPLSTYPSSVKLLWLLRNVEKVREAYEAGRLTFGTVDTWLLYNINGGKSRNWLVTDATNASRTMFLNLHSLEYDERLLSFFELDRAKLTLPKVVPSSDPAAFGSMSSGPLKGVRITGCLGDQSAALVGQCAFSPGLAKNTYGTGCFLLYNVGDKPVISKHGLLATVAYHFGKDSKPIYALEGSIAVAGSGLQFLANNMKFFSHASEVSDMAATVPDSGGLVFVTAFSGLFAPYWIDDAKGTIFGITQHTQQGHVARATIEATCFQTKAILDSMERDSGHKLSELAADGGMSNSDLIMQTQADIIGIPVDRPVMRETTALGSAIAAGFAINVWKEFDELKEINKADRTMFQPTLSKEQQQKKFDRWEKAVEMARGWADSNGNS